MNTEILEQACELLQDHVTEIAEMIFAPSGMWFFVEQDGTMSSLLTQGTRLNPANWEPDEWVLVFSCTQDLDDVPAGEEVDALENWLLDDLIYDDIRFWGHITFPAGGDEEEVI
ncbi:MAG: hypothetical protein P1Q69_06990 [Candidatus Thorarchaeota archaeon]|nr:hypothetical protein [Candidatus Thorarchaeota archaeon]